MLIFKHVSMCKPAKKCKVHAVRYEEQDSLRYADRRKAYVSHCNKGFTDSAYEGSISDITCLECRRLLNLQEVSHDHQEGKSQPECCSQEASRIADGNHFRRS